jgi:solute carrier family 25 (mitochondrial oxoglutarate transporter), member 11
MQSFNLIAGASAVSGFFASACSLPFDYVKTQIQKMQPDANGKYPYTGSLDCAVKTFKSGGPFKFYTGFPVYCVRIAPHVMVNRDIPGYTLLDSPPFTLFFNPVTIH